MAEIFKSLSTNFLGQLLLLSICIIIVTIIGALILKSSKLSFRLLVDPGSNKEVASKFFVFGAVQTIIAIIIVGSIISVLTNKLITIIENDRLQGIHATIKESFDTHRLIKVRRFLSKNNLEAKARFFNIENAEIRLELGREDIMKCIRKFGELRLRKMLNTQEVVIEDFQPNTSYGTFINRNSNLTIISTQNYGDACIGHFNYTIASNLNANYISNEFFSSGSPLKERQINFAANDLYLNMSILNNKEPLDLFIQDLNHLRNQTELFIYIGPSNEKWNNDIHIMFRGSNTNNPFKTEKSTYTDLLGLQEVYMNTKERLASFGFNVGTHEEFLGNKDNQLPNAIFDNWGKETIRFHISSKILWNEDEEIYYKVLLEIIKTIEQLDKKVESSSK